MQIPNTSMLPPTVCLLLVVCLTGPSPPVAAAHSSRGPPRRYGGETFPSDAMLNNFVQSPRESGSDKIHQLKRAWDQGVGSRASEEQGEQVARRGRTKSRASPGCNYLTGKCSAGWKRSPSRQQDATEYSFYTNGMNGMDGARQSPYGVGALQAVGHGAEAQSNFLKRAGSNRGSSTGQHRVKYVRSSGRSRCNKINGRCSAGWKRSPVAIGNGGSQSQSDGGSPWRESVFDILERLEN